MVNQDSNRFSLFFLLHRREGQTTPDVDTKWRTGVLYQETNNQDRGSSTTGANSNLTRSGKGSNMVQCETQGNIL